MLEYELVRVDPRSTKLNDLDTSVQPVRVDQ